MNNENINQELVKANITDTVIAQMKNDYMSLVVKDISDIVGFQAVTTARKGVKSFRCSVEKFLKELRAPAVEFQKAVVAKEKELVAKISEIEDYLTAQEEVFNPKEVKIEEPITDDDKIKSYVKSIFAVKVPVMETTDGQEKLDKITKILSTIK